MKNEEIKTSLKKYGFLFGAGAELAYNMPSGGQFALDIFRQNPTASREYFKEMRGKVNPSTTYANEWLPDGYLSKLISVFGKSVFESIISSTVEHNRSLVIDKINSLDEIASSIVDKMRKKGIDVDFAIKNILDRDVSNVQLSSIIAYNDTFKSGNKLFGNNYFSSLLLVYKTMSDESSDKIFLRRILLSVMQLQLGALGEEFSKNINDNLFAKKDEAIDLFDDFGPLLHVYYKDAGTLGLELLLERRQFDSSSGIDVILNFAQNLIENIYATVLDYKSLIDSNWHSLFCPRADWAKFCKIAVFLLTVHGYITKLEENVDITTSNGYYNMLKDTIDAHKFDVSAIATTNYSSFIEKILGYDITYLNGSTSLWYDPYLNKIGKKDEFENDDEHHIIVPLMFTQSGTKPMTAISMSIKYVELYQKWKESDAVVVVGFGFGSDDEHINGILRTLVNENKKNLIIVSTLPKDCKDVSAFTQKKAKALKIRDSSKIRVIVVDSLGESDGKRWVDLL